MSTFKSKYTNPAYHQSNFCDQKSTEFFLDHHKNQKGPPAEDTLQRGLFLTVNILSVLLYRDKDLVCMLEWLSLKALQIYKLIFQ